MSAHLADGQEGLPWLLLQYLTPMTNQKDANGRQDAQGQVRPVKLRVHQSSREEVAKHDHKDDRGDDVDEDLEPEQAVDVMTQIVQVRMNTSEDVKLKCNTKRFILYLHIHTIELDDVMNAEIEG